MKSNPLSHVVRLVLVAALMVPVIASAQEKPDSTADEEARLEPAAIAALDRMGKALNGLTHFTITSDASTEVVLDSGQKIEIDGNILYRVQRPDRLFVDIKSDRTHRQLFYDGNAMTLYSPRLKYYASVDGVDATLVDMATRLSTDYGIDLPLADLFLWGTERAPRDVLVSAIYVGAGMMDGERVDHYAYQQPGVDWQLWIGQARSLPQKIVITSLDDPSLPQYSAQLKWDTNQTIDPKLFTFKPPEGSARIELLEVDVVAVQTEEK